MRNNSSKNWEFSNDGISLLGKFHFIVMGISHSGNSFEEIKGLGKVREEQGR